MCTTLWLENQEERDYGDLAIHERIITLLVLSCMKIR
jgi:hypothetical protein